MATRQGWGDAGSEETPFHRPGSETPAVGLAPLLGNALGRASVTALHGAWSYIVDQANLGETNPMMHGGVGRGDTHGSDELLEYSFEGGETLRVPGDWNTQHPELFWYRGVIWYRRDFGHRRTQRRRVFLYFGGANFRTAIHLNGRLMARHAGGFTPFNVEITAHLLDGDNRLVVKVDSRSGADDVPTEHNDWLNYGGLTREVLLIELSDTFIRQASVQLERGRMDALSVHVQLDGPDAAGMKVRLLIAEAGIDREFVADATGRVQARVPATPQLWSPETPKRYRVEILAGEDRWVDDVGFRTLAVDGTQILLNGRPVFLRGISLHEERLRSPGRAWGGVDADEVVEEVRALGANFVRLAHYPHNEYMVRACDAAGILVWAELPVYHAINFANPATLDSAREQFSAVIARDVNRAAVVLWSVANETEPGPARNDFLAALAAHVRVQDDTRLVTAALHGNHDMRRMSAFLQSKLVGQTRWDAEPPVVRIDDPLAEHLDVVGYNEYYGWYTCAPLARALRAAGIPIAEAEVRERMLAEMPRFRFEAACGKPIVVSEFGAEAVAGLRAQGGVVVFSEDYQARVYEQQLAMLACSPAVRGLSPWILKDFRAPYRLHTRLQQYWNRKGVVSEHGERKLAFAVLAKHYREGPCAEDALRPSK